MLYYRCTISIRSWWKICIIFYAVDCLYVIVTERVVIEIVTEWIIFSITTIFFLLFRIRVLIIKPWTHAITKNIRQLHALQLLARKVWLLTTASVATSKICTCWDQQIFREATIFHTYANKLELKVSHGSYDLYRNPTVSHTVITMAANGLNSWIHFQKGF